MADIEEPLQQEDVPYEPKEDLPPKENIQEDGKKVEEETPQSLEEQPHANEEDKSDEITTEEQPPATATTEQSEEKGDKEEEGDKEEKGEEEGEGDKEEEIVEEKKELPPPEPISGSQLKQLLIGSDLLKAKKGSKTIPRLFKISNDLVRLIWNSQKRTPTKAQIPLSLIQEIVPSRGTASFRLHHSPSSQNEECCFSIIFIEAGITKTLDLIASTPEEASLWCKGLLALTYTGVSTGTNEVRQRWLRSLFNEADVNGDGSLDLKEVIQMMKKLNVGISNKVIKGKFQAADTSGNSDNKLDFEEFAALFSDLSDRPEMRKLFNLYASSDQGDYMSIEDLTSFLVNVQNVSEVTEGYCQSIIERFEPSEDGRNKYLLSLDGFVQFMLSDDNDIFIRSHKSVYQDMTHPLSHYFIASSHNTYLLEDQLSGPSSVNAYITALNKGCRCVELDCWDGEDDEPIVYHGHTLTSKIFFKDAITAIKDNAFNVSPYPVILSIENHCSVKQQSVMADHMINIFGDMLHKETRNHERGVLPSPEELKYKILIKAKKLPAEHEEKSDDEGEVSDEDEAAEIDPEAIRKARATSPSNPDDPPPDDPSAEATNGVRKVIDSSGTRRSTRRGGRKRPESIVVKPSAKRKLSSKLSKCVNYIQSVHFKGFEHTPNLPFFHMSSFGESAAVKSSEELGHHFVEYNKNHLSRTYPSGRRVDSSNYEPINMWNAGCQIVALNYQTSGKAMDWNIGKFQQNGNAGYLLKPEIMRQDFSHFNHMERNGPHGVSPKVITIHVISGQQLPKPEGGSETGELIDPYVQIQFAGVPLDNNRFKTKVISDNGFNPVWNESFSHVVNFPELTMVRIKVMDYDRLSKDDFIGQFTFPLNSMETGYRHVHLYNSEWEKIDNATLFVQVTTHDWIGPPTKSKEKLRETTIKKTRQYHSMKPCSFLPIDTQLKTVSGNLKTAIDCKEDFTFSLRLFKESCGKPPQANVTECFQVMFQRGQTGQITLCLEEHPARSVVGYQIKAIPTKTTLALARMMTSFNKLNAYILTLLRVSDMITAEFESKLEAVLNLKDDFRTACEGFPPKKAEQAKASFSFNVRTLRNEIDQLNETAATITAILAKIPDLAEKFSVEIEKLPTPPPAVKEDATPTTKQQPEVEETPNKEVEETPEETEQPKEETTPQDNTEPTPKEDTPTPKEDTPTTEEVPSPNKEEESVPKEEEEVVPQEEPTPATNVPANEDTPLEDNVPTQEEDTIEKEEEGDKTGEETPVAVEEIKEEEMAPKEQVEQVPQVDTDKVNDEWAIISTDELSTPSAPTKEVEGTDM